ncbi:nuclear transport factor 2 family protein [Candidatus Nephthysia bennettiae]|uniref:Nuclear transport factor 2 family protein n=1 Tax=Candidatus Nephthysia bennettiae TaxID=3127016 RepID=A0A934N3S8_9BACT|nr:nuclear transport factor 2 family protein [Candidatus Dormibacteraeota bacterium]MBJ7614073.1 nuclear transport factor 2 family protein [Candidatus Dormibacteraeota bacterium]
MSSSEAGSALSLEARLARLEDIEAIRGLKHLYAFYCDNGYDADGLASLFTEDAVWQSNHFGTHRGREAIRQFSAGNRETITWALHCMVNGRVEIGADGRTASAHWNLIEFATMVALDRSSARDAVIMTANYDESLVKQEGAWKFQRMDVHFHQISNWDKGWVLQPLRKG